MKRSILGFVLLLSLMVSATPQAFAEGHDGLKECIKWQDKRNEFVEYFYAVELLDPANPYFEVARLKYKITAEVLDEKSCDLTQPGANLFYINKLSSASADLVTFQEETQEILKVAKILFKEFSTKAMKTVDSLAGRVSTLGRVAKGADIIKLKKLRAEVVSTRKRLIAMGAFVLNTGSLVEDISKLELRVAKMESKLLTTITCKKGTLTSKVVGFRPKCPAGYAKK